MLLTQTGQNQSNMKGVTVTIRGAPYTKCMQLGHGIKQRTTMTTVSPWKTVSGI